ncbi:hypothetical protein [Comamonas sp. 4034]|uniref:hypothetical protein n=1 Tax=Comamonas sp. 4034 TaxID=3156455 RepID=UPI003D1B85C1
MLRFIGGSLNLAELISFFRRSGKFEDFCKINNLNSESEVIEIYAIDPRDINSDLGFFPIENTEGQVVININGLKYYNLFDFFYFLDVINDVKGDEKISDIELAKRLLKYSEDDA